MGSLEDDLNEMFGLSKPKPQIKQVKQKIKQEVEKITSKDPNIPIKIDFSKLAGTSDFKRLIYLAITDTTFRGSNAKLESELNRKLNDLRGK